MARTIFRLTDRIVRGLDAPGYHADGAGLYLQVSKSGSKNWIYRYTLFGRTRDMGLGSANFVSLAEARVKASESRMLAAKGVDPVNDATTVRLTAAVAHQPPKQTAEPTFREFAEQYILFPVSTYGPDLRL